MPEWYGGERCALETATGTAVWHHAGLPPVSAKTGIQWVLVRDPCRHPQAAGLPVHRSRRRRDHLLQWFVYRWAIETTFQEARLHLGPEHLSKGETQRQWSDLAIARTTPALFGLFSLVTLWAAEARSSRRYVPAVRLVHKEAPTFSDAIAAVRRSFWAAPNLSTCRDSPRPR